MRLRLLVVVATLGLAVLVTAAPADAGGGGCHQPPTEGTGSTVETKGVCFTPTVLRVPVGTTVSFVTSDAMAHTVSGPGLDYGELWADGSVQQRFTEPGTYAYMCNLHLGMAGAVVVGEAPLLASAVTDEDDAAGWPVVSVAIALGLAVAFLAGRRFAGRA
jgi:plastocyanin